MYLRTVLLSLTGLPLGALLAGHGQGEIPCIKTAAVEDTVFTGYRCWVVIVRTGSMTELRFADSLSSGAHWIIGVSIPVNPTVGAAILWWKAAVLETVPG